MCDIKTNMFYRICPIKTKIVQDLTCTNDYITNVKYFDIGTVPLEFNYNDIYNINPMFVTVINSLYLV